MKTAVISALLTLGLASAAMAQTTNQPQTGNSPSATSRTPGNMGAGGNGNPAIKSTEPNADQSRRSAAAGAVKLEAGANSFTEAQAKSRIEGAGFAGVTGLSKDDQGIWRGKAQRDGKQVTVGLDFKGNIASE